MASTDANIVKEIKEHPERLGLLGTAFDAKILSVPALTAIEVVHEYADDSLRGELGKQGCSVSGTTEPRHDIAKGAHAHRDDLAEFTLLD